MDAQKIKTDKLIPDFPEFVDLDIKYKNLLQEIASRFSTYSDFNFVSLFNWNNDGQIKISKLNENLVVRFIDYTTKNSFYSFIGDNELVETINALIDHSVAEGKEPELILVPEEAVKELSADTEHNLELVEDNDNHDYILSVEDLVEFRTNKYRGKKNLHNRFVRHYGEDSIAKELDLSNAQAIEEIRGVTKKWQEARNKSDEETSLEFEAINRCLDNADNLGIRVFGIYIKGELQAYTIFEILPGEVAMLHFDKANTQFEGIFENLKHNFAKHLHSFDIKTINFQQDLGIPGLRQSKMSYQPIDYLRKYKIRRLN